MKKVLVFIAMFCAIGLLAGFALSFIDKDVPPKDDNKYTISLAEGSEICFSIVDSKGDVLELPAEVNSGDKITIQFDLPEKTELTQFLVNGVEWSGMPRVIEVKEDIEIYVKTRLTYVSDLTINAPTLNGVEMENVIFNIFVNDELKITREAPFRLTDEDLAINLFDNFYITINEVENVVFNKASYAGDYDVFDYYPAQNITALYNSYYFNFDFINVINLEAYSITINENDLNYELVLVDSWGNSITNGSSIIAGSKLYIKEIKQKTFDPVITGTQVVAILNGDETATYTAGAIITINSDTVISLIEQAVFPIVPPVITPPVGGDFIIT